MGRLSDTSAFAAPCSKATAIAQQWLRNFSAEVTTPDRKSHDAAAELMWPDAPVYIASLPSDDSTRQLQVAMRLKGLGLCPVPHIVARNLRSENALSEAVKRFAKEGGVDRVLVLGGDRDQSIGPYESALQLIRSGVFEANAIRRIAIACYPEGHPHIPDAVLDAALMDKLAAAHDAGLKVRLISQLCFDGDIIAAYVKRLRNRGVTCDLRVGLAGPAKPATLLKYAAICGVGSSLKALRQRRSMAKGLLQTESPGRIIATLADAVADEPSLAITGLHFFTFASLRATITWAEEERRAYRLASPGALHE